MGARNYYDVLGVKQADSADVIGKAYRKLAKKYHPDLNPGNKTAEAKMSEISEAWEVLGDKERRKEYDLNLSGVKQPKPFVSEQGKAPTSNRPMTQEDFFRMSQRFDEMLGSDAIRNSVKQSKTRRSDADPLNTNAFFENVMGFNKFKKK